MFHHSNFIMIFYIFFVSLAVIIFLQIDQVTYSKETNTEYGSKLTAATHSAISSIDASKFIDGQYLWSDSTSRKDTMDTFYHALSMSFDLATSDNRIQISTPVVLFIDTDGYYIGYNALFEAENISDASKINQFTDNLQVTELIPWTLNKSGYTIRYYLNDYIKVTTPASKVYRGSRTDVAYQMIKDDPTGNEAISKYLRKETQKTAGSDILGAEYDYDANAAIIGSIQDTLNKYINEYNRSYVIDSESYHLEMPQVSGEMWHRLLENPTFIAFMQGRNAVTGENVVNTYAYAGGEYIKSEKYFVTSDGYYHEFNKEYENGEIYFDDSEGTYIFIGHNGSLNETIAGFYSSMEDCAKKGASPCPDCIW